MSATQPTCGAQLVVPVDFEAQRGQNTLMLKPGAQCAGYEIEASLGAGGMGEVYRALDKRLDRHVAIKVLPDSLTRDPERVARFEREAKLLASLSHPNIAGVYGFEESDGKRFLVMEYVDGETLAVTLRRGPLPYDEAMDVAQQIAEAVEEAHDNGIIHRDLKPGNVMLTPAGKVKVLDFGLAKAMADDSSMTSDANSPTITAHFTQPGVVLGTAAYMSPEQARGRSVGRRTDVWSFGVVLYEMLTGISPFAGETVSDTIGAILHKDVDLGLLPPVCTPALRRVLRRCLQRDRKRRLRDMADIRIELVANDEPQVVVQPATSNLLVAALVIVASLIGLLAGFQLVPEQPHEVLHLTIEPPSDARVRYAGDLAGPAVVSPDGTKVVFAAIKDGERQQLWVRDLDKPDAREIRRTDDAMFPFWSPDSESIGYFTLEEMQRVHLATNTIMSICRVTEARGGAWTHDDRIIFSPAFSSALFIVDANGGAPAPLTTLDKKVHTTHRWPQTLPDGDRFLFFASHRARSLRSETQGIYVGYMDGRPPEMLLRAEFGGEFVDDWLLFVRDGIIFASKVNLDEVDLIGDQKVIARSVAADPATWHHQFSASARGVLAFNRIQSNSKTDAMPPTDAAFEIEGDTIAAYDRTGRLMANYADGVAHSDMALSPDGTTIVLSAPSHDGNLDLWTYPTSWETTAIDAPSQLEPHSVMRPNPKRFTFLDGSEERPVWAPDSRSIAFARMDVETEAPGIYRKPIGGGKETLLYPATDVPAFPTDWTHDDQYIIYSRGAWLFTDQLDIWALPLNGGDPIALVQSPLLDGAGTVSPDGRWLAYMSRELTQLEVYVIPFAPAWPKEEQSRRWQVSLDGGNVPNWSQDGKWLYYITLSGMLMAVEVSTTAESFEFTSAQPLFQTSFEIGSSVGVFPTAVDGRANFLMNELRSMMNSPISVIVNWQELLRDAQ